MTANKQEAGDVFGLEYVEKFIRLYYGDLLQTVPEETEKDLEPSST